MLRKRPRKRQELLLQRRLALKEIALRTPRVEVLREERAAVVDQRVRVPERLEVVAAALEDHVRVSLHRLLVGGRLLRPPPLVRRQAREEERVRTEHERDLGEHFRQPLEEVRVLQERG